MARSETTAFTSQRNRNQGRSLELNDRCGRLCQHETNRHSRRAGGYPGNPAGSVIPGAPAVECNDLHAERRPRAISQLKARRPRSQLQLPRHAAIARESEIAEKARAALPSSMRDLFPHPRVRYAASSIVSSNTRATLCNFRRNERRNAT